MEILTRPGREYVKKFYADNPDFLSDNQDALLKTLSFASEKGDKIENFQGGQQ